MVAGRISLCRLNGLIVLLCFLGGCAGLGPTKPNKPYKGPYTSGFNELTAKNNLLAKELGKLPEITDGISENEANALNIIAKLYQENPNAFDSVFKQMYQIGLPEVRKYCSPLQAIFWLAEDDELDRDDAPISDYSLKKLLDKAWKFDDSVRLSEDQITDILNGIKNSTKKEDYLARRKRLTTGMLQKVLIEAYKKNKYTFTKEAREIIKSIKDSRWEDFDVVTARLNSPELINYYERRRFRYGLRRYVVPPQYVFKHNVGACESITAFTVYCLQKAGYRAQAISQPLGGYWDHQMCLFEMNGKKYVMDNGRPYPKGILPFEVMKF
jgi:hypothetical protein